MNNISTQERYKVHSTDQTKEGTFFPGVSFSLAVLSAENVRENENDKR